MSVEQSVCFAIGFFLGGLLQLAVAHYRYKRLQRTVESLIEQVLRRG